MKYRPEIDGLRALAVSAVVLHHAAPTVLPGGYVGVDVFFVISGFLITSLIHQDLQKGTFSLLNFYERRARRIVPALTIVAIACSIVGAAILLPQDLDAFGAHLFGAATFSLNYILHWQGALFGYFAVPLERVPLLHLWSLSVEEQFYLAFPIVLLLLSRFLPARLGIVLWVALVVAFGWSAYQVAINGNAVYYVTSPRAWELLLGCVLAVAAPAVPRRPWADDALALLGLLAIFAATLLYSPTTRFPGAAALLPCGGAALFIWAAQGQNGAVRNWMASRPLVWVGLISYSLYLWHWPALTFPRYWLDRPLTAVETIAAVAFAVAAAAASWAWVEKPFRHRQLLPSRRAALGGAAVALAALAGFAVFANRTGGIPARWTPEALQYAATGDEKRPACPAGGTQTSLFAGVVCEVRGNGTPVLLWGDSHAAALLPAMTVAGEKSGTAWIVASYAACPSLLGVMYAGREQDCVNFNDAVVDLVRKRGITDVVLASRWGLYARGRLAWETEPEILLRDPQAAAQASTENAAIFDRGFRRTLDALRSSGVHVWIVDQVPQQHFDPPRKLAVTAQRGQDPAALGLPFAEFLSQQAAFDGVLRAVPSGSQRLAPAAMLCGDVLCRVAAQGRSLYRDDDHLSHFGASLFAEVLAPVFGASQVGTAR